MNVRRSARILLPLLAALFASVFCASAQAPAKSTLLDAAAAAKVLPDTVYFAGKSSPIQARNAAGVHFSDGGVLLAVLVDTSGYSSALQEKYQGYLLTEVPLAIGDRRLPAGAWGIGFVGNRFGVMDIGAHDVLQAPATHDTAMARPRPLQILDGPSAGTYRLCFGRSCVDFHRAK